MRYLSGQRVYLCGAMGALADCGMSWRLELKPVLKEKFGLTVYDPTHKEVVNASEISENKEFFRSLIMAEKWQELKDVFAPVVHWDLRAVDKSDFLIVNYDPTVSSVGTIDELRIAKDAHKPTLLKYDKSQLKDFNPWISCLVRPEHLFSSWDDMIAYLQLVDQGQGDPKFWSTV